LVTHVIEHMTPPPSDLDRVTQIGGRGAVAEESGGWVGGTTRRRDGGVADIELGF
jgi:hypothetical protein